MTNKPALFRRAPPGFTSAQWEEFDASGLLVIDNAYTDEEMDVWRDAILRPQASAGTASDGFFTRTNFVEEDPSFASLIDHEAHVGFGYDLYGEMLKLQLSELFVRSPGAGARPEHWHIDGPRMLPYSTFAGDAPLQLKVGVWLTDITGPNMGNLAFVPGSHRQIYFEAYNTHEPVADEEQLLVRRGSLTLMNTALWHRTVANDSDVTRLNLYLGYSPSWLPTSDRTVSDRAWLSGLNREQRIIMRSYERAFSHAKPPPEDVPLFLDRDTGADREPGHYRPHIHLLHRKRTTGWERLRGRDRSRSS
jgi:hypothetical protein